MRNFSPTRACLPAVMLMVLASLPLVGIAGDFGLMLNLDGDLSFTGATPEQSVTKLRQLVDDIAQTQVKTLTVSIGAGSDILYYPTTVASTWGWRKTKYDGQPAWKTRIERCRAAAAAGLDAARIAGERARERGLRFFPSYRMNDAHYCSDPLNYPLTGRFWMEHQDATISKSPVAGYEGYQHLLNFARDEVRAYRLGVVFEAIERYADLMDGFELDFNRFQIFFPPGEAERNAHLITAMVEQVRARLDAIGKRQGRRMTLVVRVPPALHNCRWAGLDVTGWMKHRLVDVVIPAQVMTLSHDMPLDEFVRIAEPAGCKVFGSIYGRAGYNWPFTAEHTTAAYSDEVSRTPTAAQVLGAALNQLHFGAAGFQLYNFNFFRSGPAFMATVSSGLANLASIRQGDRRYQVTQAYFHDHEDSYEYRKQLPAALKSGETVALRLLIGEDIAQAAPKPRHVALRLGLYGANRAYAGVTMTVRLNGRRIHDGPAGERLVVTTGKRHGNGSHPPPTEAYVQWPITNLSVLRAGWNTVEATLASTAKTPPLQIVEAEVGVLVEQTKSQNAPPS